MSKVKLAIVLGGGVGKNGELPLWVIDRLIKAKEMLENKSIDKIILSGRGWERDPGISEAKAMEMWLCDNGVSLNNILMEELSRDTFQNAFFSYTIHLSLMDVDPEIYILTSEFHMKRSIYTFEKVLGKQYSITPITLPDDNLDKEALEKRNYTENDGLEFFKSYFKGVNEADFIAFHDFIFNEENPYTVEYRAMSERHKAYHSFYYVDK